MATRVARVALAGAGLAALAALGTEHDVVPDFVLPLGFLIGATGGVAALVAEVACLGRLRAASVWLHVAVLANALVTLWWLGIFHRILETT